MKSVYILTKHCDPHVIIKSQFMILSEFYLHRWEFNKALVNARE
jgi:hypothetical protein